MCGIYDGVPRSCVEILASKEPEILAAMIVANFGGEHIGSPLTSPEIASGKSKGASPSPEPAAVCPRCYGTRFIIQAFYPGGRRDCPDCNITGQRPWKSATPEPAAEDAGNSNRSVSAFLKETRQLAKELYGNDYNGTGQQLGKGEQ